MSRRYEQLVISLISTLDGDILPLPDADMLEHHEQRMAVAVCTATGMSPEHWSKLSEAEREPWLERTIALVATKGVPEAGETHPKPSKLAMALAILADHPDWTNRQIATAAACNVKYLSQNGKFKAARQAVKGIGQEQFTRSRQHRGADLDNYAG